MWNLAVTAHSVDGLCLNHGAYSAQYNVGAKRKTLDQRLPKTSLSSGVIWAAGSVRIFFSSWPSMKNRPSRAFPEQSDRNWFAGDDRQIQRHGPLNLLLLTRLSSRYYGRK